MSAALFSNGMPDPAAGTATNERSRKPRSADPSPKHDISGQGALRVKIAVDSYWNVTEATRRLQPDAVISIMDEQVGEGRRAATRP